MTGKKVFERALHHRIMKFSLVYVAILLISLLIGMFGYRFTEGYSWLDCFLNAGMLMGGMGQINNLSTDAGRAFAGGYALYCGTFEILSLAIVLSPLAKWVLHVLHIERQIADEEQREEEREQKRLAKGKKP